jgi:hypothetical protein
MLTSSLESSLHRVISDLILDSDWHNGRATCVVPRRPIRCQTWSRADHMTSFNATRLSCMKTNNTRYCGRFSLGTVARKVATAQKLKAASLKQHQKRIRRLVRREEEKRGSSEFTELTSVVSFPTRRRSRALAQRTSMFAQLGVVCMFLGILWRFQPPFLLSFLSFWYGYRSGILSVVLFLSHGVATLGWAQNFRMVIMAGCKGHYVSIDVTC